MLDELIQIASSLTFKGQLSAEQTDGNATPDREDASVNSCWIASLPPLAGS
jgi:hypothetical protein